MTSTRPYLIRAFYDWIVDNNCTPHIVVNATLDHVVVPREFVDNGQIVLNVSISAVQGLILGDQAIEFQARFSGKIHKVYAPVTSILAIYAKENGRGMVFAEEELPAEEANDEPHTPMQPNTKRTGAKPTIAKSTENFQKGDKSDQDNQDDGGSTGNGGKGGKGKGRGHLTLVK